MNNDTTAATPLTIAEAAASYNADHARDLPRSGGSCPICRHRSCFGRLIGDPGKWCCFSTSHPDCMGRRKGAVVWGDLLDLDLAIAGIEPMPLARVERLKELGYLAEPAARRSSAPLPAIFRLLGPSLVHRLSRDLGFQRPPQCLASRTFPPRRTRSKAAEQAALDLAPGAEEQAAELAEELPPPAEPLAEELAAEVVAPLLRRCARCNDNAEPGAELCAMCARVVTELLPGCKPPVSERDDATDPEALAEDLAERAAILEFEAGLGRADAEQAATADAWGGFRFCRACAHEHLAHHDEGDPVRQTRRCPTKTTNSSSCWPRPFGGRS